MLSDSPPIDQLENEENKRNRAVVAGRGREPNLQLRRDGKFHSLRAWGEEICDGMLAIAEAIEKESAEGYVDVIRKQIGTVADPDLTPSAVLVEDLKKTGQPMFTYAMKLSRNHAEYFRDLSPELNAHRDLLLEESRSSIERQRAIEAQDKISFDEYLERYFR
jgi:glutamate--cysteine ligase